MKGTGAKRNVCPGSCVSTGAKFPVPPVESAPMAVVAIELFICSLQRYAVSMAPNIVHTMMNYLLQ